LPPTPNLHAHSGHRSEGTIPLLSNGQGSSRPVWPGGNTLLRLLHPVCFLYISDLFNLPAVTTSGGWWPFKFASGGARTCAKPSDQSRNGISSTGTGVWPGGSRFWMGVLTNHLCAGRSALPRLHTVRVGNISPQDTPDHPLVERHRGRSTCHEHPTAEDVWEYLATRHS
jgi:hypothetical protein